MHVEISRMFTFVCFVLGLFLFRYIKTDFRMIFYFVLFGVCTELFTEFIYDLWFRNTMPVGHFYMPLSFLFIALFFRQHLKGYINQKLIIGIIVVFLLFCLISSSFIKSIYEFPNITGSSGALILIAFSLALFHKIMKEARVKKLFSEPIIWINGAILMYYSANFFFYSLLNLLVAESMEAARVATRIYVGSNILLYALLSIAFLKARKKAKAA